jgi:ATP-binding cassette subfamily B protein
MLGLFKYAKKYKWQAMACPFLMVGEVWLELYIIRLMGYLVDNGIQKADMHYIFVTGAKMLGMAALSLFCGAMAARLAAVAGMGFGTELRKAMYNNIQDYSFSNIDKYSTASLVTRLTTDVTMVQNTFQMCLRMLFRAPVQFVFALFMCFRINTKVSSVFLVVIPIIVVGTVIIGPIALKRFKKMFRMFDGFNGSIQENLIAIRVVKSFVREDFEKQKFKKANDGLRNAAIYAEKLMIVTQPLMTTVMFSTFITVYWLGSKMIITGGMDKGEFSTIVTYVSTILLSMIFITVFIIQFVMAQASVQRIKEVIDEKPDINDDEADISLKVENGDIEFDNVCFKYDKDGEKNVIDKANLKIKSGETVGIIGGTGSAKTTLVSLIPRLYDVTEGVVSVGGRNVKDYSIYELREAVSVVLQKNVLFSGTIKENLRWGDKNASDEELINACKAAQAHDFIMSFPDGYDTYLGQGGVNVSGGQKQRLCIARAILKKPKILILDDSTSAVDTYTDSKIRDAFRNDIPNTTKIIIAQRISSVCDADKIVVLDDGKIVAAGTHNELLESNDIYKEVYYSQQQGDAAKGGAL